MNDFIFFFLLFLALVAAVFRADFVLSLIYLFLGIFILGRWWSQKALDGLQVKRTFVQRLFLGETARVQLEFENPGLLPVVWLQVHDSFPAVLGVPGFFHQVFNLGPYARTRFEYRLEGRRRGYYRIGPLVMHSGDLFGLTARQTRRLEAEYLIVYPKIVPLTRVVLPSRSPLGTLRHTRPIFEDPSRIFGKRDYVSGDSLRRVDWKATASTGRMQVKLFEPSIALETAIFLNLNTPEYPYRTRTDAVELAIVVAASLANWIVSRRQAVGLYTHGVDPLGENGRPQIVPPHRGRGHLMRVLDVLARIQGAETQSFTELLQAYAVHLSWGTTLLIITPNFEETFFDGLFQARRSGLDAVLIPCGPVPGLREIRQKAENFGFPLYHILNEQDLDRWRV